MGNAPSKSLKVRKACQIVGLDICTKVPSVLLHLLDLSSFLSLMSRVSSSFRLTVGCTLCAYTFLNPFLDLLMLNVNWFCFQLNFLRFS